MPVQTGAATVASESDLEVMLQAVESVPPMPASSLPSAGTFWSAQHAPGSAEEWPPLPISLGMGAWSLGNDGVYLLDDLNHVYASPKQSKNTATTSSGTMTTASVDLNPNDGGTNGGGYNPEFFGTPVDTNDLWLQIFSVSNGTAYLSLNNATDQVYEVMSRTNLISPGWQTETELFPTNGTVQTNALPFTVPELDRTNALFFRAMDWTGVTHGGNTIPDWWFYYYYGTTALSDTNLDSQGYTLLYDYQNEIDPNIISFLPVVTNNYVNSMSVPVQLDVTAGTPSYYAVSVDDTNYAMDANWQTYAGTNITVNLGLTQGWHDVWIGLRGHADDPTNAVWEWTRVKLDYTPALLVVTNPITSTVSTPMIQLQGYSPKALSSLAYDISNATGIASNQTALITGAAYSTNTWEFTTNYFQCFDVGITNGVNTFTFHATDLAGNVTTLTTNFTLNYSNKPAPTVQLYWPTNGIEICGSNIVCRGTVSDPTATVSVQLVDANGATNTAGSLVGRDGVFYAENLTLAAGTNHLTYTVTDAATNVTVTNITVTTSDLGLTLAPVVAGQTLVTGTISDPSYTIYVNGVQATMDGTNWGATITPIGVGGGAVVVNAVKAGGDPGLQQIVQPPQGVFISNYHLNDQRDYLPLGIFAPWGYAPGMLFESYDIVNWDDGQVGSGASFQFYYWFTVTWDFENWMASSWPQVPSGSDTNIGGLVYLADLSTLSDVTTNIEPSSPAMTQEHCNINITTIDSHGEPYCNVQRKADTEMKLATGGPPGSTQMNLWCISASASDATTGQPIPYDQISIGGLGNLDTNGNLWVLLPDGDPVVTPMVAGIMNYVFSTPATTEFSPHIMANTTRLDPDTVTNGADFCVGQNIQFSVVGLPSPVYNLTAIWTLPGTFVNTILDPNCDLFYEENAAFLKPPQGTSATHCWYVKDGQPLTASVHIYYRCRPDGIVFDETITGKFNVHRPTTTFSKYQDGTPTVMVTNGWLSLGWNRNEDMSFGHQIQTDSFTSGQAGYVQLISGNYTGAFGNLVDIGGGTPDTELDGQYGEFSRGTPSIPANTNSTVVFYDGPYDGLFNHSSASMNVDFSTYLMFKPSGGIWVPLRLITWTLKDEAENGAVFNGTGDGVGSPSDNDCTTFPDWKNTWTP